ncbi:hypothetical protein VR43_27420 [Streptomyces sp. NRRL S-104]|nr:hypothetical protein VR43_27420 [Streptomyces sp. NRRL S-104]KOV16628.1 hypothetical protein ADK90_27665 [Streptomyces sp. XY413]
MSPPRQASGPAGPEPGQHRTVGRAGAGPLPVGVGAGFGVQAAAVEEQHAEEEPPSQDQQAGHDHDGDQRLPRGHEDERREQGPGRRADRDRQFEAAQVEGSLAAARPAAYGQWSRRPVAGSGVRVRGSTRRSTRCAGDAAVGVLGLLGQARGGGRARPVSDGGPPIPGRWRPTHVRRPERTRRPAPYGGGTRCDPRPPHGGTGVAAYGRSR